MNDKYPCQCGKTMGSAEAFSEHYHKFHCSNPTCYHVIAEPKK